MTAFYLGTHKPNWLRVVSIPLFVSRRTLSIWKLPPRALGRWALDSGGFSELSMFGEWRTSSAQYLAEVRRFSDDVGNLEWAATQDWMCEPFILAKTGKTIREHQERTIDSYFELSAAMNFAWVPVLQGWRRDDYLRHRDRYAARGICLESLPLVGVGSICRRQGTREAVDILAALAGEGLRLHGFGFKQKGLQSAQDFLASADSLAWSYHARKRPALEGCLTHRNCANCLRYALKWRESLLSSLCRRSTEMTTTIQKRKPLTRRQRDAMAKYCCECITERAEDFCGCWIQTLNKECHAPLCRSCADIRLNVWRCKRCAGKAK